MQTITGQITDLEELNQRLGSLLGQMQDSWEGDASVSYITTMQERKRQAEKMVTVLEEFKHYIEQAKQRFTELDSRSASTINGSW